MFVSKDIQKRMLLNTGISLFEASLTSNILVVFLRHFGCVFCKEALRELADKKEVISTKGVQIVFVHMALNNVADRYFMEFNLEDCAHISDPNKEYYHAFGLRKGSFTQLYGLQTWVRGFAPVNKNNKLEVSKSLGDATQMPGIFHIFEGKILESYIHKLASDDPDYIKLAECCVA